MFNEFLFLVSIILIVLLSFLALFLGPEFLIGLLVLEGVLANIFILKEIELFGFFICAADVFIVGIVLILNLLEEFFGKKVARLAIKIYSFVLFAFFLFSLIHLCFVSSGNNLVVNDAFRLVLATTPRIIFATLFVSFCSLNLDRFLYQLFSGYFGADKMYLKNLFAGMISQLFDTVFFSLFVIDLFSNIWHVMFFSYLVKLSTMIFMTPLLFVACYFKKLTISS